MTLRSAHTAMVLATALAAAPSAVQAFRLDSPGLATDTVERLVAMFRASCIAYLDRPATMRADAVKMFGHRDVLASTVFPWEGPTGGRAPPRAAIGSGERTKPHVLIEARAESSDRSCELFWAPTEAGIAVGALLEAVEADFDVKLARLAMDGAPRNIRNNRHGCAETTMSGVPVRLCVDEWRNELQFSITVKPAAATG
jgi:hypothetical protein